MATRYFWSEFEDTRLAGDVARQQTLELKCDGIAALTMLALGFDVSRLGSAMRRMIEFNETLGATTDTTAYPTVQERERFVRNLLKKRATPPDRARWERGFGLLPLCRTPVQKAQALWKRLMEALIMPDLDKALEKQLANIQSRTGKSLAELTALVKASGLTKHGEIRDMLKRDLGMGHGDGQMCQYNVRLTAPDQVDAELVAWIRRAFDAA